VTEEKPAKKRVTARKSPASKPAAPRRARGAAARPPAPVDAPPEKCFWVNHGPVLKNLGDLRDALAHHVSDAQFAHHVGAGRNDFADWVETVLKDVACAKALRRAKTPEAALRAVESTLAAYV
jgi:hypothetical protein